MGSLSGVIIILVLIIGAMYVHLWYKHYKLREQVDQESSERQFAHHYIFFDQRKETVAQMCNAAIETYHLVGISVRSAIERLNGGLTLIFENGDIVKAINITEDWDEAPPRSAPLTIMIDDTVDIEKQRQIINKMNLMNRVYQFCLFDDTEESKDE